MRQWLLRLLGGDHESTNESQRLRLALSEAEANVKRLNAELSRQRDGSDRDREALVTSQLESLFGEVGTPASQLLTQVHLVLEEEKDVSSRDLALVAKRLISALEAAGLDRRGAIGEFVEYDPNHHQSLGISLAEGDAAIVRFHGYSFQDKVIVKTGVQAKENQ